MDAPLVKARRRPFLAPIWIIAAAALAAFALTLAVWRNALVTTVVVLRPAERQLGTIEDAPLSPAGEQRSQRLAEMFGERRGPGHIRAIYALNLPRARQTIAVLETRVNILASEVPGENVDALAARIMREHAGASVLVITPAADVAPLVRALSAERDIPAVGEGDYGTMYVVSIPAFGRSSLLRLSY